MQVSFRFHESDERSLVRQVASRMGKRCLSSVAERYVCSRQAREYPTLRQCQILYLCMSAPKNRSRRTRSDRSPVRAQYVAAGRPDIESDGSPRRQASLDRSHAHSLNSSRPCSGWCSFNLVVDGCEVYKRCCEPYRCTYPTIFNGSSDRAGGDDDNIVGLQERVWFFTFECLLQVHKNHRALSAICANNPCIIELGLKHVATC